MDRAGYVPNHLKEAASEIRKIHTATADKTTPSNEEISYLARETTKWYYCCCDAKVYLGMTDAALHAKVKDLEAEYMKKFLLNFLEKLTVKQLAAYNLIWGVAQKIIGEPNLRPYNLFFSNTGKKAEIVRNKYLEWRFINQIDLSVSRDTLNFMW